MEQKWYWFNDEDATCVNISHICGHKSKGRDLILLIPGGCITLTYDEPEDRFDDEQALDIVLNISPIRDEPKRTIPTRQS